MGMRIKLTFLAIAASAALAGCSTTGGYDLSTPEGRFAYERDLAASEATLQQSQQFLNNQTAILAGAGQIQSMPQVVPYDQPNGTTVVYCHDLTGTIIACKQVN